MSAIPGQASQTQGFPQDEPAREDEENRGEGQEGNAQGQVAYLEDPHVGQGSQEFERQRHGGSQPEGSVQGRPMEEQTC